MECGFEKVINTYIGNLHNKRDDSKMCEYCKRTIDELRDSKDRSRYYFPYYDEEGIIHIKVYNNEKAN